MYIISLGLVVLYLSLHSRPFSLVLNKTSPQELSLHSSQSTPATTAFHTATIIKDTTRTTAATSVSSKTSTTITTITTSTTTSATSKATTSTTSATSKATTTSATSKVTTTTQHVTVQNIKNLYDSHMIVSQGIKLKWIRNRMMA